MGISTLPAGGTNLQRHGEASVDFGAMLDTNFDRLSDRLTQEYHNVKGAAYGAVGNGVADDTAAIQLAIDAVNAAGGGTVYFPIGTYIKAAALTIGSKTRLRGDGTGSIIKNATNANTHVLINKSTASGGGNTGIVIENLKIDGNKANQTANMDCICLVRCTNSRVQFCEIMGARRSGAPLVWGEGIEDKGGTGNTYNDNYIHDCDYDPVKLRNSTRCIVTRNNGENCGRTGICQAAYASTLGGHDFAGDENTFADGSHDCLICDNVGYSAAGGGLTGMIYSHNAHDCIFANNRGTGGNQGYGSYGTNTGNLIGGNTLAARLTCIALETAGAVGNRIVGNNLIGMSGDAQKFYQDAGTDNEWSDNRLSLDTVAGTAGDNDWSITLTGSGGRLRRNIAAKDTYVVIADTGTNNFVESIDRVPRRLADAANIAWNLQEQLVKVTLAGNRTIDNPTGGVDGEEYECHLIQGVGGSFTVSWGTDFLFDDDAAPTLTTTAGERDVFRFRRVRGKLMCVFHAHGMSITEPSSSTFAGSGGLPAGWTNRWLPSGITFTEGSGILRAAKTTVSRACVSFDALGVQKDGDIVVTVTSSAKAASKSYGGVVGRARGAGTTETGYYACLATDSSNNGILKLVKLDGGVFTSLGTSGTTVNWVAATAYKIRMQIIAGAIKARYWLASEAEPGTWNIEVTDTANSGAGWWGLFCYEIANHDWAYVAFDGTGAPAPLEA